MMTSEDGNKRKKTIKKTKRRIHRIIALGSTPRHTRKPRCIKETPLLLVVCKPEDLCVLVDRHVPISPP